jgi:hypothetical protein
VEVGEEVEEVEEVGEKLKVVGVGKAGEAGEVGEVEELEEVEGVHLPDALHDEHAVLPAEDGGANALVQQPDERARHGVVVAPVNDLDGEHVKGPDQLAALRHLGHPWLQQDQPDHVDQVVQYGGAGALHQVPVTVQGHQHHRAVLHLPHHLLPVRVVHLHLGLQHVSVLEAAHAEQLVDAGNEQLNLVVVLHQLVQQAEGGDEDLR